MTAAALLKKKKKTKRLIKLTIKHNGNQAAVARELGISSSAVNQELAKEEVNKTFLEIMEAAGLTDKEDAADLARLRKAKKTEFFQKDGKVTQSVDCDDNTTQLKALELTCRLKGRVKDGGDTNLQVNVAAFMVPEKKALPQ